MTFIPSQQQANFLDFAIKGNQSGILVAVAGAGKSTTILQAVNRMRGSSIILAYNKKIAVELKEKLKNMGVDWKKGEAATVHAIGYRNYRKAFPGVRDPDGYKVGNICEGLVTDGTIGLELVSHTSVICQLVSLAKQRAIGVDGEIDDTAPWFEIADHFDLFDEEALQKKAADIVDMAIRVLKISNGQTNIIDFDDMVYLPLIHKIRMWQYDNVFVDEAQDTNTARRMLVAALVKRGTGRVFAVGDPCQAIYGFTGADNDSLDIIKKQFNCVELPLTVTYRCPKAVVTFAKQWVSHIEAHESAPEGVISFSTFEDMIARRSELNGDTAILCRNTKPLVTAAFALIRERIPCRIEGREVAEGLKKLATRWASIKTITALEDKLSEYQQREVKKALEAKKDKKVQEIEDKIETLRVIMNRCREEGHTRIDAVVAYLDSLFSDNVSGILTLSTIHKSKGREWKRVYWLDRLNTCPSRYATQDWERQQERHLCYVAATRSMSELIELMPPVANQNNKPEAEKAA